jgi:hypothetical protein
MNLADLIKGKQMTKPTTPADLAAALAALDFSATNAEIDRLDAERANLADKAVAAELAAERLSSEIRDWRGADHEALADAILAGQSPGEAAQAAPSREGLVDQRLALLASAGALRDRAERARLDREEVAGSQRHAIFYAAEGFIADQLDAARAAAEALLAADAAIRAIAWVTGLQFLPGEGERDRARKALTAYDGLLGWRERIEVPADVVAALKPLEGRAKGLRSGVPGSVGNL